MKNILLYSAILVIILTSCEYLEPLTEVPNVLTPEEPPKVITNVSTIKVASFNIQIFGQSKRSKPEVMDILTKIACEFDVLAIQEIRDKSETTVDIYVDEINKVCDNGKREFIQSERLGRTTSKEQYAMIYNTNTVSYLEDSAYVYDDVDDVFEREPFIAQFESGKFDFVIVNNHIKPDDAEIEIPKLSDVINDATQRFQNEPDIIVLGDLNADCSYYDEDSEELTSGYMWLIPDNADTTTKATDCTYDRIIIKDSTFNEDYTNSYGVFRYDIEYDLNQELTEDVSDHYPVWVEFYTDRDTN
jgi:endonuclease/exonuclease/phosphatase family metal-dependent hydrolase